MREMKDSGVRWIGKIPTKWTIAKAKNCVEIQNGSDPKTEGSIPVYGSGSMSFKTCSEYKEGPSVLIGRKGATLHIPHYISSKFWNVDTAFNVYSKSIFDLKYYFYCAHVFDYTLYMSQTTLPSMTQTAYENMFLPLPTKEEQYAIANQLDQICSKIDAVLEKTRASIEEYKKLKQAVITQAVTKGIRGDRPMKNSGIEWIGEIPAEWNKDKVIRVFSVIGSGTTPKSSDENLFDGNTPWIQSGDINGENLFVTKNCVSNSAIESYSALRVYQAPYLVVAMYGASVGNLSLSMIDACVNQACCVLKKPTINLKLSFYIFKAVKDYLARKAVGGGQPNISQETIKQLWLPIPSADEQIEISNYLDEKCRSVDALIAKKQQYLTEIENYKKSLIYEYVTGKKEVV